MIIKEISEEYTRSGKYLIRAMTYETHSLTEESPESFKGSMSDDQILSRLWMSKKLLETKLPIKSAFILGSWYGILPYILTRNNKIDKLHAVDLLNDALSVSKKLNPNTKHYCADANKLMYDNVDCVINPSINNIVGDNWYNNIPKGKLCLFQTENVAVEKGCPQNLQELIKKYPLSKYLYKGILKSSDKDGKLLRSMTIGYK